MPTGPQYSQGQLAAIAAAAAAAASARDFYARLTAAGLGARTRGGIFWATRQHPEWQIPLAMKQEIARLGNAPGSRTMRVDSPDDADASSAASRVASRRARRMPDDHPGQPAGWLRRDQAAVVFGRSSQQTSDLGITYRIEKRKWNAGVIYRASDVAYIAALITQRPHSRRIIAAPTPEERARATAAALAAPRAVDDPPETKAMHRAPPLHASPATDARAATPTRATPSRDAPPDVVAARLEWLRQGHDLDFLTSETVVEQLRSLLGDA